LKTGEKLLSTLILQTPTPTTTYYPLKQKKTEYVVKTHDGSETFVLQGNIVIIYQSLLNSIDCVYYSFDTMELVVGISAIIIYLYCIILFIIIHQSLLNSIFTTKLYILMKKINNYKQR
jgi:hypothetical protein